MPPKAKDLNYQIEHNKYTQLVEDIDKSFAEKTGVTKKLDGTAIEWTKNEDGSYKGTTTFKNGQSFEWTRDQNGITTFKNERDNLRRPVNVSVDKPRENELTITYRLKDNSLYERALSYKDGKIQKDVINNPSATSNNYTYKTTIFDKDGNKKSETYNNKSAIKETKGYSGSDIYTDRKVTYEMQEGADGQRKNVETGFREEVKTVTPGRNTKDEAFYNQSSTEIKERRPNYQKTTENSSETFNNFTPDDYTDDKTTIKDKSTETITSLQADGSEKLETTSHENSFDYKTKAGTREDEESTKYVSKDNKTTIGSYKNTTTVTQEDGSKSVKIDSAERDSNGKDLGKYESDISYDKNGKEIAGTKKTTTYDADGNPREKEEEFKNGAWKEKENAPLIEAPTSNQDNIPPEQPEITSEQPDSEKSIEEKSEKPAVMPAQTDSETRESVWRQSRENYIEELSKEEYNPNMNKSERGEFAKQIVEQAEIDARLQNSQNPDYHYATQYAVTGYFGRETGRKIKENVIEANQRDELAMNPQPAQTFVQKNTAHPHLCSGPHERSVIQINSPVPL
ncbi:MAG: hypothetical protein ACT4OY_03605 [Alphaproteobacteria bacterium]